jgi:hypothetical protein
LRGIGTTVPVNFYSFTYRYETKNRIAKNRIAAPGKFVIYIFQVIVNNQIIIAAFEGKFLNFFAGQQFLHFPAGGFIFRFFCKQRFYLQRIDFSIGKSP